MINEINLNNHKDIEIIASTPDISSKLIKKITNF